MIKNYFKTGWKNLTRNKIFSAINLACLAIGIAASLIIFIIVKYELSFDKFQPNYKNIYHVVTVDKFPGGKTYNPGLPVAGLAALRTEFPDIPFAALVSTYGSQITINNSSNSNTNKFIENEGIFFSGAEFFKVFNYKWITGNPSVLQEPNTVVLTKKIAEKYFKNWQQAINKTITLDNAVSLKVAGIINNVPPNTDFPLEVLISMPTLKSNGDKYNYHDDWHNLSSNFQVFTLLTENVQPGRINKLLLGFSKEHYSDVSYSKRTNFLQPLSDVHFDNRFDIFGNHITSKATLWTLSLIGIFIILMACINFINLSTAQAVRRSKEIGIRKVLGSSRPQIFLQVMSETALLVVIAVAIAMALAFLSLPLVKHIASIQQSLSLFSLPNFLFILLIAFAVTLLSGTYPSTVLSGYNPSLALKNKISSASIGGISLRRALVVIQFVIAQALIIATIVAVSQMNFVNHANLGFDKDEVLLLSSNSDSTVTTRMPAFKQDLLNLPGVESVSMNTDAPSSENVWSTNFSFNHQANEKFPLSLKFADEDYFKTFGLQLAAGRVYGKSDTINEVVVNETLVHKLGLKDAQEALGKDISLGSGQWKRIVGVVKDFKTASLKKDIPPLLIAERKSYYGITAIKLRTNNMAASQAAIKKAWNRFYPEYAYTSSFMDENIARFYSQETHLELLYKVFAGLAIFISCLGLYGLVAFMAVQKTKEIGVRKVLGASVVNIVYLFSKEFSFLILIAFVVAAPASWFVMHSWLNNFAYRINISAWVFLFAIIFSMAVAWITVSYQAIKAALANPVKSLRSE